MKNSYRFAVLSDIHIDLEDGGRRTYFIHAEKNFKRALEISKELGCDFIVSAGDQVTNASGAVEEWRRYRELISASGYSGQVFEALGKPTTNTSSRFSATLSSLWLSRTEPIPT